MYLEKKKITNEKWFKLHLIAFLSRFPRKQLKLSGKFAYHVTFTILVKINLRKEEASTLTRLSEIREVLKRAKTADKGGRCVDSDSTLCKLI